MGGATTTGRSSPSSSKVEYFLRMFVFSCLFFVSMFHATCDVLGIGDVDGSVEALLDVIGTYHASSQCLLDVVHYGVGPVTPSDIEFAKAFQGS